MNTETNTTIARLVAAASKAAGNGVANSHRLLAAVASWRPTDAFSNTDSPFYLHATRPNRVLDLSLSTLPDFSRPNPP